MPRTRSWRIGSRFRRRKRHEGSQVAEPGRVRESEPRGKASSSTRTAIRRSSRTSSSVTSARSDSSSARSLTASLGCGLRFVCVVMGSPSIVTPGKATASRPKVDTVSPSAPALSVSATPPGPLARSRGALCCCCPRQYERRGMQCQQVNPVHDERIRRSLARTLRDCGRKSRRFWIHSTSERVMCRSAALLEIARDDSQAIPTCASQDEGRSGACSQPSARGKPERWEIGDRRSGPLARDRLQARTQHCGRLRQCWVRRTEGLRRLSAPDPAPPHC
jgi:hypothetical protein